MKIIDALLKLDPNNDDHWTADGLPRMEVVEEFAKKKGIKRAEVTAADPEFNREVAASKVVEGDSTAEDIGSEADSPEEPASAVEASSEPSAADLDEVFQELKADAEGLQAQVNQLNKEMGEAAKLRGELELSLQGVQAKMNEMYPNSSDASAIKEFITSQTKQREKKVALRRSVLKHIDPTSLNATSPLDAALARKGSRGGARPNFTSQG